MRNIYSAIIICFLLINNQSLTAQATGDYRSAGSGSWSTLAWERYNGAAWVSGAATPDNTAGQVNILSGHSVTANAPITAGQLIVDAGGTLVFNDASSNLMSHITNNGTIDWMNGDIYCSPDTVIVNNSVFNIKGNNVMRFSSSSSGSEFINNGTINKESSDTTEFILGDIFTNNGTINLQAGTVITRNILTNTGSLFFNTGYLIIENTFNHNSGSITGAGHFTNSSRLTLNASLEFPATLVFTMDPGSIIDGPGDLTLNQDFTITGTISGSGLLIVHGNTVWNSNTLGRRFTVEIGRTLTWSTASSKNIAALITNDGSIEWQDGDIFCSIDTVIVNNSVFNIRGNNALRFSSSSPGSELINNGTINKQSNDTTEFILGDIFTNNGTINLQAGTVITRNIFTNTGILIFNTGYFIIENTFNHNSGSITGAGHFTNSSRLTLNASLEFPATLVFTMDPGSIIDGPGDLTLNQDFTITGTIAGSGLLVVHGNTVWNSNTLGRRFTVETGRTLTWATPSSKNIAALITNNSTIDWMEGDIFCSVDTVIVNNSVFNIRSNNVMRFSSSSPGSEFINNGTVSKESSGTTEFILGDVFTNGPAGMIKGNGTVDMNCPVFITNGAIAPGHSPGLLSFNGRQPLSANSTLPIEMQDGSGAGTGHDQLIRNGDLTLAGTLTVTESLTVPTGTYTIIRLTAGTVSGAFNQVNLPIGYSLVINTSTVQLVKNLVVTPVKLISFTASRQGSKILLHWITENEVNNQYFDVERSHNGRDFAAIGRSKSSAAVTNRKEYQFMDQQPVTGVNYYRLKQVDINGQFEYSPIATVMMDQQKDLIVLYPNPVKDMLQIRLADTHQPVFIAVTDGLGRQIINKQAKGQSLLQISVQYLSPGIYYLKVIQGTGIAVVPFSKN